MKKNLKKWGLALMIGTALYACKKDQSQESLTTDAKSWYLKNNQNTSFALVSSKNQLRMVDQQVNWNDGKTFQMSDGTEVLSVPVTFKLADGNPSNGSYLLMISKNGNSFKKQTVYNEDKEFFDNISKDQVQSAYNLGNQLLKLQKRTNSNPGRGKIMSDEIGGGEGEQPVCTDWYLIETVRDVDGNITAVYETFLFQTCTTTGGGGGGGGPESSVEIDMGSPVSIDEGHTPEENVTADGDPAKVANLTWRFHNATIYKYTSTERGTVKVAGSSRTWHSLVHQSHGKSGSTYFFTVELVNPTPVMSINNNVGTAVMRYKLKYNISAGIYNQEHESDQLSSYAMWDENFAKMTNN